MEKSKQLHLTGFFDFNFGDDMMMKLVVRSLPDFGFSVEDTVHTPILDEPNVMAKNREACLELPKLIVTGCGFMINNKVALKSEILQFLRGRKAGDYCLGCNMEPLDSPLKRFLIGRKLNRFKLITCRDRVSEEWIRRNTRNPEVHCLPDLLFSIPDEWLPKVKSPDRLGISLMHRAGDREDCDYYRVMAEIADQWIQETGKGVILMAFDAGKEDDLFSCLAVKALMQYPEHVEIVVHKDCTEIPEAFARCEKIIAARFHATVLALRMGIPVYPLIFREKVRNLLKDLRYPYPASNIDDIDRDSLAAFLTEPQTPLRLEPETLAGAKEHTNLLRQWLTTEPRSKESDRIGRRKTEIRF